MKMKLVTLRSEMSDYIDFCIRNAKEAITHLSSWNSDRNRLGHRIQLLEEFDREKGTPEELYKITYQRIDLRCNNCDSAEEPLIMFRYGEDDYDENVTLCKKCLQKALAEIERNELFL